jgi:hypothetical protein
MIFRFQFTDEWMQQIHYFARIHQFDTRGDFKDAWNQWMQDNRLLIQKEETRLIQLGFHGDILDKMFKSARYYFRKKTQTQTQTQTQTKSKTNIRKPSVGVPYDLLVAMDAHIQQMQSQNIRCPQGFLHFCKTKESIVRQSIAILLSSQHQQRQQIAGKIKKTYQNRYFVQKRRMFQECSRNS